MASNQNYSHFRAPVFTLFVVFCLLKPEGHYALNQNLNNQQPLFHTVSLTSLVSIYNQSSCNNVIPSSTSYGASNRKASLRLVHRYGACSSRPQGGNNKAEARANLAHEILSHDQARIKSIKARLQKFNSNKDLSDQKTTNIRAQSGLTAFDTSNYVVEIGIGNPAKQLSLVFDTGSDITWTQCQPCATSCYKQQQPIFDPAKSTSYSNIACSDPLCSELQSDTGYSGCSSSACIYRAKYGDNSYTEGIFAKETLTLSGGDVLENIPFGCGQNNKGLFGTTAGLIGLGRHPLSLVSQTAQKYGEVFSYCLPTTQSTSGGYLSFGKNGLNANLQYTPFSTSTGSFYNIQMTGINVGGSQVLISATDFQTYGETIFDSGTVITRLPTSIYIPLREAFKKQMAQYKPSQPVSIFDTCYDLSGTTTIQVPTISFSFSGNAKLDVNIPGILYGGFGRSQVCLAFAEDPEDNIFGNSQQQTLEVVYDVAGGKIGFAPGACS